MRGNIQRSLSPFDNPLSRNMLRDMSEFSGAFGAIKPKKVAKKTNVPKIKVKPKKVTPVKKVAPVKKAAPVKKVVKATPKPKPVKPVSKPVKNAPVKKAVKVKKITNTSQIPANSNGVIVQQRPNETPVIVAQKGSGIGDKLFSLASQVISSMGNRETIQTVNDVPVYNPSSQSQTRYQTDYSDNGGGGLIRSDGSASGNIEETANTLGSGVGGLFGWAQQNLGLVCVFGLGAFLLMKQPPQYGNRR